MKIKALYANSEHGLERQINDFIMDKDIINIKYVSHDGRIISFIHYK